VLQVLGLTWPQIRVLAVKKLGERNVSMIEQLVAFLMKIFNAGPAAAWAELKAHLADLKAQAIDALQNWIVTTVIQAAVTKILSMLNPAGAIVQAVIAIYNTVMFIVERIGQIMAVVEAIINSVTAIAQGAIGGAANWIEQALGRLIPVVIGLLARLAGLGKITAKITEFIRKVQSKVHGAIEKIVDKGLAWVKNLFKGGKGKGKDGKDKKDDKEKGEVKVKVRAEISSKVKGVKDDAGLSALLGGVFAKYKSEGLKSLSVLQPSAKKGQFGIDAAFSPGEKIADFGIPSVVDLSDLNTKEPQTVLLATVNGKNAGRHTNEPEDEKNPPKHAEVKFNAAIRSQWDSLKKPGGGDVIEIRLTRSPCGSCGGVLGSLQTFTGARLVIKMMTLYQGRGGRAAAGSKAALKKLALNPNIELEVWDVFKELGKLGIKEEDVPREFRQKIEGRVKPLWEVLHRVKAVKKG
jgi:hypothetical protein